MSASKTAARPPFDRRLFDESVRLHRLGRLDEAERGYGRLLAADPDHALTLHLLGMICAQRGDNDRAIELIERSLALDPAVAEAHYNLGAALHSEGRIEAAATAYRRALALKPGAPSTHLQLSIALQELGETAEARAEAETALRLDPTSANAWYVRRDLKTFAPGDPDIERMEALLASAEARQVPAEDRLLLEFALAKAWMDVGDADRAFAYLETANRLKRASFEYDVGTDVAGLAAIADDMSADKLSALAGAGHVSDLPVFVVGMPRSGTTLVEQIIASHPDVHGAGELLVLEELIGRDRERDDLAEAHGRLAARLTKAELTRLGADYAAKVAALGAGARRVVDKAPGNFRLLGLITLMLPKARIIHCRRDPVDTCFSCFTRNFSSRVRYAFGLGELGRYYRAYERLMDHWRATLPPAQLLEVDYEAVVEDLEGQARRLVAFCGLDWDAACLDFHATRRTVRTISVNQVRRPIYRDSIARWKAYERHLAPLIEALRQR